MDPGPRNDVFLDALNRQGHAFQYAVIQAIHRTGPPWEMAVAEFPVSYRGRSTHVDLLAWCHKRRGLLIGECKRVNPAFSNWVFARAPFSFHGRHHEASGWLDQLFPRPEGGGMASALARELPPMPKKKAYHIAYEMKGGPGDPLPKEGRGQAFNDAITQVDEGTNGLITTLADERGILDTAGPIIMLPAVFTTAKLFTTDAELHQADLTAGDISSANFSEVDWLWFEHNLSPELIHATQRRRETAKELVELLPGMYTRHVAIVSGTGIDAFLRSAADVIEYLVSTGPKR